MSGACPARLATTILGCFYDVANGQNQKRPQPSLIFWPPESDMVPQSNVGSLIT